VSLLPRALWLWWSREQCLPKAGRLYRAGNSGNGIKNVNHRDTESTEASMIRVRSSFQGQRHHRAELDKQNLSRTNRMRRETPPAFGGGRAEVRPSGGLGIECGRDGDSSLPRQGSKLWIAGVRHGSCPNRHFDPHESGD